MFAGALDSLDATDRDLIIGQLDGWANGSCSKSSQVAANIRAETALSTDSFLALLRDFCGELKGDPADPRAGWKNACRKHKYAGAPVPPPGPARLGRALPIGQYAKLLAPKVGLTDAKAEDMIRKIILAGPSPVAREARLLRKGPLGRFLIWATFRNGDSDADPFEHLPKRTEAIRTALGLGECPETETLVLVTWRREGPLATLAIYRPTVADAEMYSWYRPVADPTSPWGSTAPLSPNPASLPACPEVVHEVIAGETLVFPVCLAV